VLDPEDFRDWSFAERRKRDVQHEASTPLIDRIASRSSSWPWLSARWWHDCRRDNPPQRLDPLSLISRLLPLDGSAVPASQDNSGLAKDLPFAGW
jgi:hypothetical protein